MPLLKASLVLLTSLFLIACRTEIVSPEADVLYGDSDFDVEIAFPENAKGPRAGGLFRIRLNYIDVTEHFVIDKTGAYARASDLEAALREGSNYLRVSGYRNSDDVTFYYDSQGPEIHITATDWDQREVSGYVVETGEIAEFRLNNEDIALTEGNRFTASFDDAPLQTFAAEDSFGRTAERVFAHRDMTHSGLSARLNQGGFDFLVNVLEQELNNSDLSPFIADMEPVRLLNTLGLFDMSIAFNNVSFDDVDVDLNVLDNERIDTGIAVQNARLGFNLTGRIGFFIPYNSTGSIRFTQVNSGTDLLMDIENADLALSLSNTSINHTYPVVDFDNTNGLLNILDALVSAIVAVLAPVFEYLFVEVLEQIIVPVMSDFIRDIPIVADVTSPTSGEVVTLRALPQFLDSKDRGVTVDLDTQVRAQSPEGSPAIGSLYSEGTTPSLGAQTPAGEDFHFGASISDNVINQAMLAALEAGMLNVDITQDLYRHATPEGISVYRVGADDIEDSDEIRMRLTPLSPPQLQFNDAEGAAGTLAWYDVALGFDLYKARWGEFRTVFGVTFDLTVPFDINATENGYLSIGIEQMPAIRIHEIDEAGMIQLTPGFVQSTLDYFMPWVMPTVAERLDVVPLPRIYNHTLYMRDFWVAGQHSLSLAGDLVPIQVTEAASTPATQVQQILTEDVTLERTSLDANGVEVSEQVTVRQGEVVISLDGLNPNAAQGELEYRYRVDGGSWSVWKARDEIRLRRLLAGDHEVEICSRSPLMKREESCPVVTFTTELAD
ncbi:MAG: hypothetical protein VXZ05_10140 [Pseudomonadota bacterium]|nr:hypothetical protein [Pseudomonadota bacterium]